MALFCCIPDSEKSLNYLVGLMYGQLIQTLYYEADRKHKGRLPVPVHLLIDEAPNISLPTDSFLTSLATMRSRGILRPTSARTWRRSRRCSTSSGNRLWPVRFISLFGRE